VAEESTQVRSSKPRTALFLAAMRHFAQALQAAGRPLHYTRLDAAGNSGSLQAQLQADILRLQPARLVMTAPGDWRVLQAIKAMTEASGLALDIREDRHFFCSVHEFAAHAKGRKSLRMEYFYREQRKRHAVLMNGDEPIDGQWNFDADNREATRRWNGDAAAISTALAGVRSIAKPHPAPWLLRWAECASAPALFPPVDRRCDSFSQWWARASRGLHSAADLLAVNEVPAC
jgi:hypothetical protein